MTRRFFAASPPTPAGKGPTYILQAKNRSVKGLALPGFNTIITVQCVVSIHKYTNLKPSKVSVMWPAAITTFSPNPGISPSLPYLISRSRLAVKSAVAFSSLGGLQVGHKN